MSETPDDIIEEVEEMVEDERYDDLRAMFIPLMQRYHRASVQESIETTSSEVVPTDDEKIILEIRDERVESDVFEMPSEETEIDKLAETTGQDVDEIIEVLEHFDGGSDE